MDTSHHKQVVRNNKDTIQYKLFPIPIVKKIVQDILRLDSCNENLKKTNQELSEVYEKINLKDSIITDMTTKENNFKSIIQMEREKNVIFENKIKTLEFNIGVQKVKGKLTSFLSGGFILILGTLFILKH